MAFLSTPANLPTGAFGRTGEGETLCLRRPSSEVKQRRTTPCATLRPGGEMGMRLPGDSMEGGLAENALLSDIDYADEGVDFTDFDDGVVDILGGDYDLVEEKTKKVRLRTSQLLDAINTEPETNLASDADTLPPIRDDETMAWVRTVVRAGDTRKAINPMAIRVMRITYITSFMVALTGKSTPQLRAISNLVEENMFKEHGVSPKRSSGVPQSGWILLDYGDMIVNVFSPEQREKYNLEGLWKDGEFADVSDCITQAPADEAEDLDSDEESLDVWL